MAYSENAKNFISAYGSRMRAGLTMQIQCSKESETYKAIEELRDTGLISFEVGQVLDDSGNKICDLFGIQPNL
jgi:hypothetical protein